MEQALEAGEAADLLVVVDLREAVALREAEWEALLGEEEWEVLRVAEEGGWADLQKGEACRSFMLSSVGTVQLRSEWRARWNRRRITVIG